MCGNPWCQTGVQRIASMMCLSWIHGGHVRQALQSGGMKCHNPILASRLAIQCRHFHRDLSFPPGPSFAVQVNASYF